MKVLSVMKPYDKPLNAVGASWAGCMLNNELINHPEIEELAVVTNLPDYSPIDPRIDIFEVETNPRKENRELLEKTIDIYHRYNYDVVHLHIGSLGIIKWIAELVPDDVNLVYTLHTPTMLGRSSVIYGKYGKLMNNKPNLRIVGPSDYMQEVWHEFSDDPNEISNLHTVYNGVAFSGLDLVPSDKRNGKAIMCGRLTPMKRALEALQVARDYQIPTIYIGNNFDLKDGKPDYYFEMCKEILESCDNIEWIKHASNPEVLKMMSEATCLITMSNQESFGLTVAEAVSVGTPVIYTTGGAVEEVLGYGDVGTKLEFVYRSTWHTRGKLVREAFDNISNRYDPQVLRDYFLSRYTLPRMAEGYIRIYQSLGV